MDHEALILSAGGLRGGHSYGALKALNEVLQGEGSSISEFFETIAGASAGAATAWYTLAGQFDCGDALWTDAVSSPTFMNMYRLASPFDPALDSNYLIQSVFRNGEDNLNLERFLSSDRDYFFPILNVDTKEIEYWGNLDIDKTPSGEIFHNVGDMTEEEVYNLMEATIASPILYNRAIEFDEGNYVDGAVMDYIPDISILSDDTKKIIFLTKHPDVHEETDGWIIDLYRWLPFLRGYDSEVYDMISKGREDFREFIEEAKSRDDIFLIYPSESISSLENNKGVLERNVALGYDDLMDRKDDLVKFLRS